MGKRQQSATKNSGIANESELVAAHLSDEKDAIPSTQIKVMLDNPHAHGMQTGGALKLATSNRELFQGAELAYRPLVAKGLIESNISKTFFDFYSLLPNHHTFVLSEKENFVGTVGFIVDSAAGLPSDLTMSSVNRQLRIENKLIGEIRALAAVGEPLVSQERRTHIFMSVIYYAARIAKCELLNSIITDGEEQFYKDFCSQIGASYHLRQCQFSGVEMITIDLRSVYGRETWWNEQGYVPSQSSENSPLLMRPVLTRESLKELIYRRSTLISTLTHEQWSLLKSAYQPYFDLSVIIPDDVNVADAKRAFRYMTNFRAIMRSPTKMILGQVFDVSATGIFFRTDEAIDVGSSISLYFQVDGETLTIPMKVRRVERAHQNRYPAGYGLEIQNTTDNSLFNMLKNSHAQVRGPILL